MRKHNIISTGKHLSLTHFQKLLAQAHIRIVNVSNTNLDVCMKL